jgi:23S rRNA pseudouridine2605 synthase
MHPKKAVPKTYVVKVAGMMQPKDLDRWRAGIRLEDGVTLPAKVSFLRGRNQQIRRMGEASGFPVMRLARLSFAGVTAEGLRPGEWRYLSPDELKDLKKEYGVPKRIVAPEAPAPPRGRARMPRARAAAEQPRYGGGRPVGAGTTWSRTGAAGPGAGARATTAKAPTRARPRAAPAGEGARGGTRRAVSSAGAAGVRVRRGRAAG